MLGPFIPFASPTELYWTKNISGSMKTAISPDGNQRSTTTTFAKGRAITKGFKNVLKLFHHEHVGVVVRLNDEL